MSPAKTVIIITGVSTVLLSLVASAAQAEVIVKPDQADNLLPLEDRHMTLESDVNLYKFALLGALAKAGYSGPIGLWSS